MTEKVKTDPMNELVPTSAAHLVLGICRVSFSTLVRQEGLEPAQTIPRGKGLATKLWRVGDIVAAKRARDQKKIARARANNPLAKYHAKARAEREERAARLRAAVEESNIEAAPASAPAEQ